MEFFFFFFLFSLPIQTILDVQASIGALPPAKRRWFHQILESFPSLFLFYFIFNTNSDNLSEILTLKRATTTPGTQILKYWTNICKPKEVFSVWVCGKRFGSYNAIISRVFDEMSKLISPPPKLIILLCNNKAYPISIT